LSGAHNTNNKAFAVLAQAVGGADVPASRVPSRRWQDRLAGRSPNKNLGLLGRGSAGKLERRNWNERQAGGDLAGDGLEDPFDFLAKRLAIVRCPVGEFAFAAAVFGIKALALRSVSDVKKAHTNSHI